MKTYVLAHLAALTMAAFLAQPAPAASPDSGGVIHGIVTDPSGAAVPRASIVVSAHHLMRTVSTDETGHFAVPGLPPGHYSVEVNSPGFSNFEKTGLVVSDGYETEADAQLRIASLRQRITVTPEPVN